MTFTRRSFLWQTAGALATAALLPKAAWAANKAQIKIGSCSLGLEAAKQAGLDGVQVWAGDAADELDIFKASTRAKYKAQMQATGLPLCSFMMGLLNNCLLYTSDAADE